MRRGVCASFSKLEKVCSDDLERLSTYRNWLLSPALEKQKSALFIYATVKLVVKGLWRYVLGTYNIGSHVQELSLKDNPESEDLKTCWFLLGSKCQLLSPAVLVYSMVEYGAPVWLNSRHTKPLDCQLNTTMKLVSGTLKQHNGYQQTEPHQIYEETTLYTGIQTTSYRSVKISNTLILKDYAWYRHNCFLFSNWNWTLIFKAHERNVGVLLADLVPYSLMVTESVNTEIRATTERMLQP